MIAALPIIASMLLTNIQPAESYGFSGSFTPPSFNFDHEKIKQEQEKKEKHRRMMEDANRTPSDDEIAYTVKLFDDKLKAITAYLIRYEKDFKRCVDEGDTQDGRETRRKLKKMFESEIYNHRVHYDRKNKQHLKDLYRFIWHSYDNEIPNRQSRITASYRTIKLIYEKLKYLDELLERVNARKIHSRYLKTMFDVFVYFYHLDIRLAVAKHNEDWDEYNAILKEADSL